jgi:O-acetyl-ADP-ribose deacetylase (regulator of RNase III)
MELAVGKSKISLVLGDITELATDGIVNAANNQLWMGAGVAGAIKRKGGKTIEEEAVKKGPIPVGEAVATTAGELKAKYVIHAAGMGTDLKTNKNLVEKATLNSLKRTEELGLRSIAFPAIGTGVGGFPMDECAEVMIKAAKDFLERSQKIEEIVFALYDKQGYDAFENQLKKLKGE